MACSTPIRKYPVRQTAATTSTYGSCVDTWFTCSQCPPAEAMIVVSEIGEQWSPHTAPARQEAIEITIICPSGNTPITIGIRMLKVPQDVPVAKASSAATRKMIIGRKPCIAFAEPATRSATKTFAPSRFVMPDKVHAIVRIRIGAIMERKPSGIHSVNS